MDARELLDDKLSTPSSVRDKAPMNWRRLSGGIAAIILSLALVLTLGFGPAGSPLEFVDETPLDLTLEKATQGTAVVVCNFGQDLTVSTFGLPSPFP
jgi:hypothetical protein